MHEIGWISSWYDQILTISECDTCGAAVSDPDLHKQFTQHDIEEKH